LFIVGWGLVWSIFGLLTAHGLAAYVMIWLPATLLLLALQPHSMPLLLAVLAVNLISNVQTSMYFSNGGTY
jgi:hypothetical protein